MILGFMHVLLQNVVLSLQAQYNIMKKRVHKIYYGSIRYLLYEFITYILIHLML